MLQRLRNRKGAAVVEFALVMPVLLLLIFGVIDFGFYFFVEHTLQYATREGMRLALVGKKMSDGDGNLLSREASVIRTIREHAALAVDPTCVAVYLFPVGEDYQDPEGWDGHAPDAGDPGSYMRVRTRYTYRFITPFINALVPGGKTTIEAQGTYRNELFDL